MKYTEEEVVKEAIISVILCSREYNKNNGYNFSLEYLLVYFENEELTKSAAELGYIELFHWCSERDSDDMDYHLTKKGIETFKFLEI